MAGSLRLHQAAHNLSCALASVVSRASPLAYVASRASDADDTRQFLLNSCKLKHPQADEATGRIIELLRSREAVA